MYGETTLTGFVEAQVLKATPGTDRVQAVARGDPMAEPIRARIAIETTEPLRSGDRILLAGEGEERWVIGVLGRAPRPSIALPAGARAAVAADGRLEVFTPRGELLFEYDAEAERARIRAPSGDLELLAPGGSIALRAAESVRIGGKRVEVAARRSVSTGVVEPGSDRRTLFRLDRRRAVLEAPRSETKAEEVRVEAGRITSIAGKVVSKVGTLVRTVAGLALLRAGRRRVLVEGSLYTKSKRATLKSVEDFRIDGEKIHLG